MTDPSGLTDWTWLVELFPRAPGGAEIPYYYATRDLVLAKTDPLAPNREYDGRVETALTLRRTMHGEGRVGGRSLPARGVVSIAVDTAMVRAGDYAALRALGWDGARVRILRGKGRFYSGYELMHAGVVARAGPAYRFKLIEIPIADVQERVAHLVSEATYAGTGGFEGGENLKGKHRPDGVGVFDGAEPVLVDDVDLWWDIAASGLHSVEELLDGGKAWAPTAINPPADGCYFVDLANGRLRTGGLPEFQFRVRARSAAFGAATTIAGIAEGVLTAWLGFDTAELDAASVAAHAARYPETVGRWWGTAGKMGDELLDELVNSRPGQWSGTVDGLIRIAPLAFPADVASATDPRVKAVITDEDLRPGAAVLRPVGTPPWRIEVACRRNHAPVAADRLAGGASLAARAFAPEEWRIVAAERAASKTLHSLSEPLRVETCLDETAAGETDAGERLDLFGAARMFADLPMVAEPFSLEMGDVVWVASAAYDLFGPGLVVADDQSSGSAEVAITVWMDL